MMRLSFELRGSCGVPDGTTKVTGLHNHFRLPGGQIVSIQAVIEMESAPEADDHRDISYAEAVALELLLDCDERTLDLESDDAPGQPATCPSGRT